MYGIRGADGAFTSGYLKSMETQERWGWHSELLDAFENKSIKHVVAKKLGTEGYNGIVSLRWRGAFSQSYSSVIPSSLPI